MKKNIDIAGFTQKQRLDELERIKTKYEKKGYKYIDYTDNGMTKSFATFEIDEANIKQGSGLFTKIFIIFFVVIVGWFILSPDEPLENKTLRDATNLSLDELLEPKSIVFERDNSWGILFECNCDIENGIALFIKNGEIKVGSQDDFL